MVSLDFIRHFVFWERVPLDGSSAAIEDGCYCQTCLSRFEKTCGVLVDRSDAPAYIRRHLLEPWSSWKCQRVVEIAERFASEIRALAPGVPLAIQAVPWRDSDLNGAIRSCAGQDIGRLAQLADLVAPMAFTHMLGMTAQWKEQLLAHVRTITGKAVCFYVQADALYRGRSITVEDFDAELTAARSAASAAIVILEYEQLLAQPDKAAVLRHHFRP